MSQEFSADKSEKHILTIAKGGTLSFVGHLLEGGFKYLFDIIIAIFLGSEIGGVYFLSASIVLLTLTIALFGLQVAIVRFTAMYKGKNDEARIKGSFFSALLLSIVISSGVTTALFLASNFLANAIFHKPDVAYVLKYLSLSIPLTGISYIIARSTRAFKGMKYEVYALYTVGPIIKIGIVIILLLLGWGLKGAIIAYIASSIVGLILSIHFARRTFAEWRKEIIPIYQFRKTIKFALPSFMIGFLSLLLMRTDILVLGYISSTKEVGIYNIAARISFVISLIYLSFNAIFSPIISELHTKNEHHKLNELFKVQSRWIFTVGLPAALFLLLFANPILSFIGEEFSKGSTSLIILASAMALISSIASVEAMLVYSGKVYLNMFNNIAICIVNLVLNFLLIPRFGIVGAAIATAISLISINLVGLAQVVSRLKLNPLSKSLYKPLTSAVAAFLLIFLMKNAINLTTISWLIIYGFIFLCIYIVVLYLMGLEKEDLLIIRQIRASLNKDNVFIMNE